MRTWARARSWDRLAFSIGVGDGLGRWCHAILPAPHVGLGAARRILLELAIERLAVEAQLLGCPRLVPALGDHHTLDVLALQLFQRHPPGQRAAEVVGPLSLAHP